MLNAKYRIQNLTPQYTGPADREDAMIGRWGHVTDKGMPAAVLQVYIDAKSARRLTKKLAALAGMLTVTQHGDTEAVGTIRTADLDRIARIIGLYRIGKPRGKPFAKGHAMAGVSAAPSHDHTPAGAAVGA